MTTRLKVPGIMAGRRNRSASRFRTPGKRGRFVRLLKLGWWSVCLAVIAWWIISADPATVGSQANEPLQQQVLKGIMALLAFPAGLLWVWFLPLLTPAFEAAGVPVNGWPWYATTVLAWLGCAVLGYLQWFWLLPHVFTLRSSDS